MTKDNVVEIDFDEEETLEILDGDDVVLPSMETASQDTPATKTLKVAVLGDNNLSKLVEITSVSGNRESGVEVKKYTEIDSLIEDKHHLVYLTEPLEFSNDVVDDAKMLDSLLKIFNAQPGITVIIKSTIGFDTAKKIVASFPPDKVVYSPEETCDDDLKEMLNSTVQYIGSHEDGVATYVKYLNTSSTLDRVVVSGNIFDIVATKLVSVSYKALFQTFWNQVNDYLLEDTVANYNFVKKNVAATINLEAIPSYVKAMVVDGNSYKKAKSFAGEYNNRDVRILSSSTHKLPLLDECINFKNLKD